MLESHTSLLPPFEDLWVMIDILTMFLKLRLCNKLLFDKLLTLATLLDPSNNHINTLPHHLACNYRERVWWRYLHTPKSAWVWKYDGGWTGVRVVWQGGGKWVSSRKGWVEEVCVLCLLCDWTQSKWVFKVKWLKAGTMIWDQEKGCGVGRIKPLQTNLHWTESALFFQERDLRMQG